MAYQRDQIPNARVAARNGRIPWTDEVAMHLAILTIVLVTVLIRTVVQ